MTKKELEEQVRRFLNLRKVLDAVFAELHNTKRELADTAEIIVSNAGVECFMVDMELIKIDIDAIGPDNNCIPAIEVITTEELTVIKGADNGRTDTTN